MQTPLPIDACVELAEDVVAGPAGDELILLDVEREMYYGLNPTGRRMWEVAAAEPDLRSAATVLTAELPADRTVVERDLLALMQDLVGRGLVRVQP